MSSSAVFFAERFWCPLTLSGGVARVSPAGEIDVSTAPTLACALREAQRNADLIVIDLAQVAFMDSSGARMLAAAARSVREAGGRLVLDAMPAHVERVLRIVTSPSTFTQ